MRRFFGTDDLGAVSSEGLASGIERMLDEFGLETDKGRRFAMWSLLYMLGSAPDLDLGRIRRGLVDRSIAMEGLRAALELRKATPAAIAEAAQQGGPGALCGPIWRR